MLLKVSKFRLIGYTQLAFSAFSLISVFLFAFWWFNPEHIPHNFNNFLKIIDIVLFVSVSYIIWHPIVMDVLLWVTSMHIKPPRKQKPVPGLKVAFITTIVPSSEPLDLLHKTLPAMVNTSYPHQTWVLDEGDHPEVKRICNLYGVMHFSRFGKHKYNTPIGKFTKTKGGNHNSWYDVYGDNYDIVAQVDADFVPGKNFLIKTIGYFRDPKIAFVGTPQIYGNTEKSFVALGAFEQQFSFYGAFLRGLSGMGMMLLIGANHVIRVKAFKQVGHYTAHITEDLITGIKIHANGWKSIYVPYPLAIGEGPATWESYFNQQLRWAYGCMDILFHHSPKQFKKMGLRKAIYYFFLQQHYFSGPAMAVSVFLLSLYFFFGLRAANVDILKFLIFYSSILLVSWLMSVWLQRYNIYRKNRGELLLAGKIISIAAWPIWFLGFINILIGKRLKYKVTPKGEKDDKTKTSPFVFIPHLGFAAIVFMGLLLSIFTHKRSEIMFFWAFSSIVLMVSIPFVDNFFNALLKIRYKLYAYIKSIYINSKNSYTFPSITLRTPELIKDGIFICLVVFLSSVFYINKLGFYSDDWSFLGNFSLSYDQSIIGLYKTAATPNTFMRPVQNALDATLFWLFGTQPIGYQIINALVFTAIIILFYLVLSTIKIPRIIALSASLVFALLPNYSTDRFWFAAFQVNLSMMFFLLSSYSGLKACSMHTTKSLFWKIVSILSLIFSILSYEIALPLVFINMILFWNPLKRLNTKKNARTSQNHAIFITLNVIVLCYLILFKALTTTRLGSFNYPADAIRFVTQIFYTNYGILGVKLPFIWGEIMARYLNPSILTFAFILYFVVFLYLYSVTLKGDSIFPTVGWMRNLILFSIFLFIFGYALFFINNKVGFSPTGIDNRVAIAASIGFAFTIVGVFGFITRFILPEKYSKWFFCILIAIMCSGGFLIINTLASFWASAYQQSNSILSDIREHFPVIPKSSTFILDGVCPYVGPGIVFESQWDLKGALQILYHNPTIKADIVTPRLKVTNKGIDTQIYTFKNHYPYKNLFIYNFKNKQKYLILNAQAAYSYFQKFNPDFNNGCPPASAGNGVNVF